MPRLSKKALEQRIQVLDTASGDTVLSVVATPVVLGGQNFSLSPDGLWFVLLRGTTLEFYNLPQMSADEQAKYTAVKADVPGLYVPAAETPKAEGGDEPVFTASDTEVGPAVAEQDASSNSSSPAKDETPKPLLRHQFHKREPDPKSPLHLQLQRWPPIDQPPVQRRFSKAVCRPWRWTWSLSIPKVAR